MLLLAASSLEPLFWISVSMPSERGEEEEGEMSPLLLRVVLSAKPPPTVECVARGVTLAEATLLLCALLLLLWWW
jgi:hypothetical protein